MTPRLSDRDDWNSHVRGGWVAIWLWTGSKLSTRDIARLCGVSVPTAHRMMVILECKMPITKVGMYWQWISPERD